MLTITGLIQYHRLTKPATPEPKKARTGKVFTPIPANMTNAERMRARRVKARQEGKCSMCTTRWPEPGLMTCSGCLKRGAARKKRAKAPETE